MAEAHSETHLAKFEELLEAAIDLDRVPDEYLIAPAYDQALGELQGERDEVEAQIMKLAKDVADDLGLTLDKTVK